MRALLKSRISVTTCLAGLAACLNLVSCSTGNAHAYDKDLRNKLIVSIKQQKLLLVTDGIPVKSYKISTSKFGLGDQPGSNRTPLGHMEVARKIGDYAPLGAVFKSRRRTGEILKPNAPGRDPIVTRILWLKGNEKRNQNAFGRMIYIHGTTEEDRLGKPASYGCIRMASQDIADLYKRIDLGADVFVVPGRISKRDTPRELAGLLKDFKSNGGS